MADRLEALHRRIDDLTDPDGRFAVVCPPSGKRPVPVRGKSFPTPDVAETAVDLVREYRTVLREVDPHLEKIPLGVVEETADPLRLEFAGDAPSRSERERTRASSRSRSHPRGDGADSPRGRKVYFRGRDREPSRSITLSDDGDDEWLRMDRAPVVTVREDGEPIDDAAIERQLKFEL